MDEEVTKASLGERSDSELVQMHFEDIWVEYQTLDPESRKSILDGLPERLRKAVEIADTDFQKVQLVWSDLTVFRIRVLRHTPEHLLRARAAEIRSELQSLVGDEGFKRLRPNGAADERTAEYESLLADLIQIVELIGQATGHSLSNEGFRKGIAAKLTRWVLPVMAASGLLALLLLGGFEWTWFQQRMEGMGAAIVVSMSGVLGAYVSAHRRMQPPPIQTASFGSWFALRQFYNATKHALVLGGIFGLVWWMLLLGGVVTGPVFPTFQPGRSLPATLGSWALLIVWCFLAGFAERLVLDTLDRLANSKGPVPLAPAPSAPAPGSRGAPRPRAAPEAEPAKRE